MKIITLKFVLIVLLTALPYAVIAHESEPTENSASLKQFIVHFSLGPAWDQQKPPQEQTGFAEHSANMQRLRSEGVIVMGARYAQIGMLIIESDSMESAEAIIQADPAVHHQIFNYSVEPVSIFYPWKTSATND